MATAAVLTERAESLGLPITKNAFEGTLENRAAITLHGLPFATGSNRRGG